ncbi:MAG: endonuclease III domain-containing protein [Candidatus Hodarchaeales archaeon]|jgi:endonuclease-3
MPNKKLKKKPSEKHVHKNKNSKSKHKKTEQTQDEQILIISIDNKQLERILEIIQYKVSEMRKNGLQGALISGPNSSDKYSDPFRVLIGCIISLRTKDEVTGPSTDRLFQKAKNPALMSKLSAEEIAQLIYPAGFYKNKSIQIKQISTQIATEFNSKVPDDLDTLISFKGVGRKTANLVITKGFGKLGICVDTHVARIVHRIGYIPPKKINEMGKQVFHSADEVEMLLRKKLPKKWWIPINDLLVSYGKLICAPLSPKCSQCAVSKYCHRVGVTKSR